MPELQVLPAQDWKAKHEDRVVVLKPVGQSLGSLVLSHTLSFTTTEKKLFQILLPKVLPLNRYTRANNARPRDIIPIR
jgi:hypothetical protein